MEVNQALIPIFIETEIPKGIKQIGTGVFIDFRSQPFLFTAAHVTDSLQNGKLLVPTIEGLEEIEGYLAHLDLLPELSRNDDSIDMAYYRLSNDFARKLFVYFQPLIKKIELVESSLELNVLSVVGYPASKSKKNGGSFSSELAYYRGIAADNELYEKHNLLTDQNIIIHFHKKNALNPDNGQKMNPPSPRGVSGGAIFAWPYGQEFSQDWRLPMLVGILHSYKEKEGLFVGTTLLPYLTATALGEMRGYSGLL
ncbi:hypothetical protein [uncultured Methylophaga sp.]|uniref:hypothetical protein n=1 Tax=uncultured Methylophaga sp. TaxID=285271 RepID=UPI00261D9A88|nr:hypothetical protein [uncultured Methylophaga sp.]